MLRNQKLITVDLAAEVQVNTNFVLPQRGNTILRRVNTYRQNQRESTVKSNMQIEQQIMIAPVTKQIGARTCTGLAKSINQSSNCKNFMLPDSPRASNYEFSLPYQDRDELRKRPMSTEFERLPKRKSSPHASLLPKEREYLGAVKQATQILRKTMVLNFVDNIQRALPIQTKKSLVQPPKTVSQERINQALRQSVSRTERQLKVSARETKKASVNSVSPTSTEERKEGDFETYRMNQTVLRKVGETAKLGLIIQSFVSRPKSMRAGQSKQINKQLRGSDALSNSRPLQNVLSETNASTQNNALSQLHKIKLVLSQKPTNFVSTDHQSTINTTVLKSKYEVSQPVINQAVPQLLSTGSIKNLGHFQIYVPLLNISKDDRMMRKFVGFASKGYLKQAEMSLQAVKQDYPGRLFNSGLLALLQNDPERCFNLLTKYEQANHNYQIAQRLINQKKVIQDNEPGNVVNNQYFKRTFPYGHQQEKQETIYQKEVSTRQVSDWDLFLMQVKRYKKDEFAKFVEDKAYFDKVIQRINHICDRESQLIPNCLTRIKKEEDIDQADTEQIVNVTQLRDTVLRDAPNLAADKSLEEVFIEMLNIQSTYCVGAKDPIQESFDFLIEGLRTFDEKFDLETFVNEFQTESAKENVEDIKALLERYDSSDRLLLRARTFIMSCFDSEHSQDQKDQSLNVLLRIVREAKEAKLKRIMDPARFEIESLFIHLVDDIITASRNEQGPGPLAEDDQYLAKRLNFHRELSGRSKDVHLMKIVEYSKLDLERHQLVERAINQVVNFAKIDAGHVSKEKKMEIQKKLMATWARHITKPLSKQEHQAVMEEVQRDIDDIERTAKQRILDGKVNGEQTKARDVTTAYGLSPGIIKQASVKKDLASHIKSKVQVTQNQLGRQQQLKKLDDSEYEVSAEEEEVDLELELEIKRKRQQQELLEQNLKISCEPVQFGSSMANIWQDHPGAVSLRQALHKIQLMCDDEKVIFDNDQVRLAPLLEKWGIQAQAEKEIFDQSQIGIEAVEVAKAQKERPKIGRQIPQQLISYLKKTLSSIKDLFQSEINKLDEVMVENFRFFSIIDRNVRMVIFKSVQLVHFEKQGTLVERDVEETDYVYVVIQGTVDYKLFKYDTNLTVVAATYRTGEVFGDASIQRQYFDVFKCLSKDRKYLETSCDDVYALRIPKDEFVAAIFAEMRVELMYKILMFRNTTYFKELSPYSLVMFASICDVMDYKYGEIILAQGNIPEACYIVASGQCQAVYPYVEQQSTLVSKHARKVLHKDVAKPVIQSKVDYKNLALLQARDSQVPTSTPPKLKQKKQNKNEDKPQQLQVEGPSITRAYFHGVLKEDNKAKIIHYENHIPFGEIRQGQVFCARTLLDYTTFNKHVAQNSIRFAEQLTLVAEDWIENQREKRQNELHIKRSQTDNNKSFKTKAKICKECFGEQKKNCECQNVQREMLNKTSLTSGNEENQIINTNEDLSASFVSNGTNTISDLREKSPLQDFQASSTRLKRKVNKVVGSTLVVAPQQAKAAEDYSDETYQRMFIEHMHDNLLRSQTSIMVTSATAKLIVIKKEDKTFLNEALKQSIDKVIIEENFQDHDRPLQNFKQVQKTLEEARSWITHKKQLEEGFLKEAKFNRNLNKLLD